MGVEDEQEDLPEAVVVLDGQGGCAKLSDELADVKQNAQVQEEHSPACLEFQITRAQE